MMMPSLLSAIPVVVDTAAGLAVPITMLTMAADGYPRKSHLASLDCAKDPFTDARLSTRIQKATAFLFLIVPSIRLAGRRFPDRGRAGNAPLVNPFATE